MLSVCLSSCIGTLPVCSSVSLCGDGVCLYPCIGMLSVCLPVSVYRDAVCLSVSVKMDAVCLSVSVYRDAVCLCIGTLSVCLFDFRSVFLLPRKMYCLFLFSFLALCYCFFYFAFVCNSCHVKVILKLCFEIFSLPTRHSFVCTTACFLCLNAAQIMFIMFGSVRNNL